MNTLTSIQGFYRAFGSIPADRLPGAIKGPFKAIRYYLGGQTSIVRYRASIIKTHELHVDDICLF